MACSAALWRVVSRLPGLRSFSSLRTLVKSGRFGILFAALLLGNPVWAQGGTSHGPLFRQSPDYQRSSEVAQGCLVRFSKALDRMVCAEELAVTLSIGKETVVTSTAVLGLSRVRCGCLLNGYESTVSCNEQASWLGRIRVMSVAKGTFTVRHSWAIGNEVLRCEVG